MTSPSTVLTVSDLRGHGSAKHEESHQTPVRAPLDRGARTFPGLALHCSISTNAAPARGACLSFDSAISSCNRRPPMAVRFLPSSCLAENPHSCTKSATNRPTFGEVSAAEPAAPTPLKGARHQTGPHSRLADTEGRSRLRVPGPGGRSPQEMAALRQRGVFDVVRPHACAVAQADRCGAGWRPVSTMQRCVQTHRRRGSEPDRDHDAPGC